MEDSKSWNFFYRMKREAAKKATKLSKSELDRGNFSDSDSDSDEDFESGDELIYDSDGVTVGDKPDSDDE